MKQKSEISSTRVDTNSATNSAPVCRTHVVIKDVLTTTKPYDIVVNESSIELLVNSDDNDNKISNGLDEDIDSNSRTTTDSEVIEVPNWRLHPVSSCYSLEGTEVCIAFPSLTLSYHSVRN